MPKYKLDESRWSFEQQYEALLSMTDHFVEKEPDSAFTNILRMSCELISHALEQRDQWKVKYEVTRVDSDKLL